MSDVTATRTRNPHRTKGIGYLRDGRVTVRRSDCDASDVHAKHPPRIVVAHIKRASGDPTGLSTPVTVSYFTAEPGGGIWECDTHPSGSGWRSCAHRYAVQFVTGYGDLGGRCRP